MAAGLQPGLVRLVDEWAARTQGGVRVFGIVAPTGYGKTVFMSILASRLRARGLPCLRLAPEAHDASLERLLAALVDGMSMAPVGMDPTQALLRGNETIRGRIDALIEGINALPQALTLMIDNLDECADPQLGYLLDALVFRTQSDLRLVLSSTRELPLDVSRAQLDGLLWQLGARELSFDAQSVRVVFGGDLCARIGDDGIAEVLRQTEGWPAAVRMLQMILSAAEEPLSALKAFSGSDESLSHLLNREVFTVLPPAVRRFMLGIAHLDSFCASLCCEALGDESARTHLAYLVERNVFVMALDRNRSWYRLHGLFRDFLRREAEDAFAEAERARLFARAARWCETHGHAREAVEYALSSGDVSLARDVLERISPLFVHDQGNVGQYLVWVETLHARGHRAGFEAEYWYVWALSFMRRFEDARRQGTALAARVERHSSEVPSAPAGDLMSRLAILRAGVDSLTDHMLDAHAGATRWLGENVGGDPLTRAAAHCIELAHHCAEFDFLAARRCAEAAREAAFQAQSPYVDGWVGSYAALMSLEIGDYQVAWAELKDALAAVGRQLGEDSPIFGTLSLVAARCAAEMGAEGDAWHHLQGGLEGARHHGFPDAIACGIAAALSLWRGADDSRISLPLLRRVVSAYPPRMSITLSCLLVQRQIVLGALDDARDEADRVGLEAQLIDPLWSRAQVFWMPRLDALVTDTRVALLIAEGRFRQAEQIIGEQLAVAKAAGCVARAVALSLAAATVAVRSDRQALAVRHVSRAVRLAATRNIVRPFHDSGATLTLLVEHVRDGTWGWVRPEEQSFFAERCAELSADEKTELPVPAAERNNLLESLTAREMAWLRYLDAGLSNQQIADRADVKLTTVKWHLRNLYEKLSVTTRLAALVRARSLNLL